MRVQSNAMLRQGGTQNQTVLLAGGSSDFYGELWEGCVPGLLPNHANVWKTLCTESEEGTDSKARFNMDPRPKRLPHLSVRLPQGQGDYGTGMCGLAGVSLWILAAGAFLLASSHVCIH